MSICLVVPIRQREQTMNQYEDANNKAKAKLKPIISEFQSNAPLDEYSHYTLTLLPKRAYIDSHVARTDLDARDAFVVSMYKYLDHRLMQNAFPNYKRASHAPKRIRSLLFIEHQSRDKKLMPNTLYRSPLQRDPLEHCYLRQEQISHLHAAIAIHKSCEANILECFKRNHASPTELCLREDAMPDASFTKFFKNITYATLKPLADQENLENWCVYSAKESVYRHDFPNNARIYQHNY